MEIVCKKCKHPNQMGAIFCRECGEKLELDKIKPKQLKGKKKKININVFSIVCFALGAAVILGILLAVVPIFPADTLPDSDSKAAVAAAKLQVRLDSMLNSNSAGSLTFSAREASLVMTAAINKNVEPGKEFSDSVTPRIVVSGDQPDKAGLIVRGSLWGMPYRMVFSFAAEKENPEKWRMTGYKIGNLPIPFMTTKVQSSLREKLLTSDKFAAFDGQWKSLKKTGKDQFLLILDKNPNKK